MSSGAKDRGSDSFENKPLAGLAGLRAQLPSIEPELAPASSETPAQPADKLGAKLVVRHERKKRGGKTVTRVSGLEVGEAECGDLARELKRALGCGASLEGGDILVQGSLVERVAEWLEQRGGGRVVRGN